MDHILTKREHLGQQEVWELAKQLWEKGDLDTHLPRPDNGSGTGPLPTPNERRHVTRCRYEQIIQDHDKRVCILDMATAKRKGNPKWW
jgi:hypothetical protein